MSLDEILRVCVHICVFDHPACLNEIWADQTCHSGVAHYKRSRDGKMKRRGRARTSLVNVT